jgi:hypothetical protein
MPPRLDQRDLAAGVILLQVLSAFGRSSTVEAVEARPIADRLIDGLVRRAFRSDADLQRRSGLVEAAFAEFPRWIIGAPQRWLAQRKTLAAAEARHTSWRIRRYATTLPLRHPAVFVHPGGYILLMSHMRSYSTLLAHLLASNREIAGHSGLALSYRRPIELVRARARVAPDAVGKRFVLDKILHDEWSIHPSVMASGRTYAIFLVRRPEPTIQSILRIRNPAGSRPAWYRDPHAVVGYYERRLAALTQLALATRDRSRTVFLRSEALLNDPEPVLEALTRHLTLNEPLSTAYTVFADTGLWGAGDTSEHIHRGHIEQAPGSVSDAVSLPQHLLARACDAYDTRVSALACCFEELG